VVTVRSWGWWINTAKHLGDSKNAPENRGFTHEASDVQQPLGRISGWWFGTWLLFSMSYMGYNPSH